jgi:hypothetical protein
MSSLSTSESWRLSWGEGLGSQLQPLPAQGSPLPPNQPSYLPKTPAPQESIKKCAEELVGYHWVHIPGSEVWLSLRLGVPCWSEE